MGTSSLEPQPGIEARVLVNLMRAQLSCTNVFENFPNECTQCKTGR